ncbi:hypothetical protein SAMN05443637_10873 [Pseudonocardia thermophila]|jgi:hypothetical protein|uniref:Uncharacterized protein n=2 Tax=Pseudonocardia thermophila TaxID=1848 RepID=A0A1M6TJ12_PSETH|nr:hypothetical protein [Pseudonocardia thermophila]SHK56920.1 hypothetical protein SAMN05443637_10873 [Pseudonocardia thermophila]
MAEAAAAQLREFALVESVRQGAASVTEQSFAVAEAERAAALTA